MSKTKQKVKFLYLLSNIKKKFTFLLPFRSKYRKVPSSKAFRLEARAGFFRLLMILMYCDLLKKS